MFFNGDHATKEEIRQYIWSYLEANDIAEFPRPVHNRIPNFQGSEIACSKLTQLMEFQAAQVVKVNPDKPQEHARYLTLEKRKTLLVPTPRMRHGLFNKIVPPPNPDKKTLKRCSVSMGLKDFGIPLKLEELVKVNLVVIGSVAVSKEGKRIGKGEGFADLEYAIMASYGVVGDHTTVVSVVHDCQVFDSLPEKLFGPHDLTVDVILTPTNCFRCIPRLAKPTNVIWNFLTEQKMKDIPVLKYLRKKEQHEGKDVTLAVS